MEPDHTPIIRNADDSGIRCATSYGLKAPRAQKNEGQSPYLVSQGFSRWGVTNRIEREGPSSSTFDFTGHKVAKTRILSKWLTKLTHLCCVLSLF